MIWSYCNINVRKFLKTWNRRKWEMLQLAASFIRSQIFFLLLNILQLFPSRICQSSKVSRNLRILGPQTFLIGRATHWNRKKNLCKCLHVLQICLEICAEWGSPNARHSYIFLILFQEIGKMIKISLKLWHVTNYYPRDDKKLTIFIFKMKSSEDCLV